MEGAGELGVRDKLPNFMRAITVAGHRDAEVPKKIYHFFGLL